MFKDYHKYLSVTLKVYLFVLVVIFILKIVGFDYFGIDSNNVIIISLNDFLMKNNLKNYLCFIFLMIYQYIMMSIIMEENSKKLKLFNFITFPFTMMVQYYKTLFISNPMYYFVELLYLILICKIYNKKTKLLKILKVILLTFIMQFISNFIRNFILTLDYLFMLLIVQNLKLRGGKLCQTCQEQVGLYSLTKANLRALLKKLQVNLRNFKNQSKENKLTIIIYLFLSLIWNFFTIFVILLIATINRTFIECIFILTSFWLSKRVFGKAFHLSSMLHCFIISNLTYYFLNRITTPLGISILVPIMLGVGLSYVTSKLVKKTYKPLYKGMPEDLFEETILKVTDKDSIKYKICYESYILNKSDLSISFKYNYSLDNVNKIKTRINNKIKKLN